jgi:hypothetical protein
VARLSALTASEEKSVAQRTRFRAIKALCERIRLHCERLFYFSPVVWSGSSNPTFDMQNAMIITRRTLTPPGRRPSVGARVLRMPGILACPTLAR